MASYIFSNGIKLFIFFLPLNTERYRMNNAPIFCVPDLKKKKSLSPILYFIVSFPKLLWDFISELINLNYVFSIPFKINFNTNITRISFQFRDSVKLNILPTFSSEILILNWAQNKFLWSYLLNINGNFNINV